MQKKKLFLLDAMALIYRAYFALSKNPRVTSYGKNTNAQFGFVNTLVELLQKEQPSHLAVVFDTKAATQRHEDFTDYKANRQAAPEDLILALPDIKNIVKAFSLPCLELDGYEADDLIGTLAWQAYDKEFSVYMVTPDKDYGQLVKDNVFMYKPAAFGIGPQILGPQQVCEKWGIKRVEQVIDLLGLMGDASDNIPGIKGVGEKTASKLLATYDTLENVLLHADQIKGALGEKISAGKESAILSKKLATIITNAPIQFDEEAFKVNEWNKEALQELFTQLEFKTLGARLLGNNAIKSTPKESNIGSTKENSNNNNTALIQQSLFDLLPQHEANIHNTEHQYILLEENGLPEFIHQLLELHQICFDTETSSLDANNAELVGMSFSWQKSSAYYLPIPSNKEAARSLLSQFQPLWDKQEIEWVGHNIKYDLLVLKWYGIEIKGSIYDTMLAHYLIDPDGKRSMDNLSRRYLNYDPIAIESLIGKKGKDQGNMRDVEINSIKEYAAEDADITLQLKHVFDPIIKEQELNNLLNQIENPLVQVLCAMEYEGINLDIPFLKNYSERLQGEIVDAQENVFKQAGLRFNLASPKQLGEVLFEHLKLDEKAKKTKTGQYATGEDVLQKLQNKHKIVEDILNFRELTKLKSTYVDALPLLINPKSGRLHSSFNQALVVTGRLSSQNPNLQNIPIRTARGREIRKAFIPRNDEHYIISADYSQIELRIIAAISGDKNMIEAFMEGKDIHTATASKVYKLPENEVDATMRRNAKAVNFGIIYGQSAFGLAENLNISRTEAKTIIEAYFEQFPMIKAYMNQTVQFAHDNGYVQTIDGRKRPLNDIHSSNAVVRGFAERNAINMPIQGTAADMIKKAMIAIHYALKQHQLNTKLILQVHDELLFDVPKTELESAQKLILTAMENAMKLPNQVPVVASLGYGNNWLEAH